MTTNNTNLKYAIEKGNTQLVEFILAKPEKPTNLEECLSLAIEKKIDDKIIDLLVKQLTNKTPIPEKVPEKVPELPTFPIYKRPIQYGCDFCYEHSVFICDLKDKPNTVWANFQREKYSADELKYKNEKGATALHYLAYHASEIPHGVEMFASLMDMLDINEITKSGGTPLRSAMIKCGYTKPNLEIVKLLLNHPKIDLNIKDRIGVTIIMRFLKYAPSHVESGEDWMECFKMLLNHKKTMIFEIDPESQTSIFEMMFNYDSTRPMAIEMVKTKAIPLNLKTMLNRKPEHLTRTGVMEMIKAYVEHWSECLLA